MIAPYATILAAQFMPREAVENLARLKAIGALGRYGFYDAVDFTPQRVPEGTDHAVVYNYMAHHSGHVDRRGRRRRSSKAACATASTAIR